MDEHKADDSSKAEGEETRSREALENKYAMVQRLGDGNARAYGLNHIGCGFNNLYSDSHVFADLERAISILDEAMQYTSAFSSQFAKHSSDLGGALLQRFNRYSNTVDIDKAIALCQYAVKVTKDSDQDLAKRLNNLGNCYLDRFNQCGETEDIDKAVATGKRSVALMRDGDPNKLTALGNVGSSLRRRFERFGNLGDLTEAITLQQTAVNRMQDGHPDKPALLNNLGNTLESRFDRLGDIEDLEKAILFKQTAVNLMPDSHPNKPTLLNNLGSAVQTHFQRLGDVMDLEKAISFLQAAVDLTPDSHPDKPGRLNNLGNAVQTRFQRLGDVMDNGNAISFLQSAVNLTPDGHPDKPSRLNNLGGAVQTRFERLGDVMDLEKAISLSQAAVDLTPDGHPHKPNWLNTLGRAVQTRFERLGDVKDLEKAISLSQAAVDLTPDGHPHKPVWLNTLGAAVQRRSERLGDVMDLKKAISFLQTAVDLTPDGHPHKPRWLNTLGGAVQRRFERLGDAMDNGNAISLFQASVDLTPDGHPDQPSQLNNLGSAVQRRFERLGDVIDLEKATLLKQTAVDLTPDGHPDKPGRLTNLGVAVQTRFERLGDITDLEKAISFLQAAVDLMPDGPPDKPSWLNNLGAAVQTRFERQGDITDLEKAISLFQATVDLTPDGHPHKPGWLSNLGDAFVHGFRNGNLSTHLQSAILLFSTAANSLTGPSVIRFRAACKWGEFSHICGQSPIPAFERAINLLPQVAWLGTSLTIQHAQLTEAGDEVRYAVAVAIELGEYEIAVQWAEYGRSTVWQNLLSLRTPLDDLHKAHPELAMRLQTISQQLEGSLSNSHIPEDTEPGTSQDLANKATTLAAEREEVIEKVRKKPGFEYFLKAKPFDKLAPAAHEGPVVIINMHERRCDALVLIPHDLPQPTVSIVNIPLENFSYVMSTKLFKEFSRLLSLEGVRARGERQAGFRLPKGKKKISFESILADLWVHVVKPVLGGLAYRPGDHSRIWWCATGPLAFLPIHAAGNYASNVIGEKISDYVISSYTPTLTAILDQSQPKTTEDFQILTVAQPSTPGASPLPATEKEVQRVQEIASGIRVDSLIGDKATTARVLQAMKQSNWIHLAYHGLQHRFDSLKSGFLLHDETLELSELIKQPLPKADFAFLSACQTAMGDEKIAEESVHLAAGMLFSGCKGVIGTMWSIRDNDAPKVTKVVYERMLKDGKPNRKEAARALHEAVKELRESGADFLSWVPFIHMGR
ncbi:hypothetical protein M408DRAFT_23633 [Serendipita vermifera MAFF 305830]|uniref:CHAT domain-containing protein n=1 Tax=Serendipita vermifera MAFF 305830 TaxID=933852 RepID=A0A0C3B900_SERVB|nr:hypothetical protein M408DRAFT_23633 [Serendipita vermifera MAFF 305830]